jgi:hypothetical protein
MMAQIMACRMNLVFKCRHSNIGWLAVSLTHTLIPFLHACMLLLNRAQSQHHILGVSLQLLIAQPTCDAACEAFKHNGCSHMSSHHNLCLYCHVQVPSRTVTY